MLAISIDGTAELRALKARLSAAARASGDRSLGGLLSRNLRAEAEPAKQAVRRGVLATRGGSTGTGLRRRIAGRVQTRVRTTGAYTGVQVRIDARGMPSGQRALPARLDGEGRWRHPVYGNTRVWVSQRSDPYFDKALRPLMPKWQQAAQRAMQETAAAITRG